jgi:Ca-activated chloride channel family protein
MRKSIFRQIIAQLLGLGLIFGLTLRPPTEARAQAGRVQPSTTQKKNKRSSGVQPQTGEPQEAPPPDVIGSPQEAETVKVETSVVNVDAVVYHKKTRKLITGLKKENFAIFEDGVQREITNFATPEAPITVAMVLEYSKLTDALGGNWFEPGRYEVLRPMAMFLSQFVRPEDYVSVIAYDMRPTPLTDFTNDPGRIRQVIDLLLRNFPASREANLFDALKFTLIGGKGDAVVLENSKQETMEYAGLAALQGRRTAVILVSSGIDTFSKINYDEARRIVQSAGVPIYIIGTANLFFKKYGDQLEPTDYITGFPGRLTFLQAQNALNTFAKESGGAYFPVTFEGELPSVLQSIDAMLRNQYSLGFKPSAQHDGKPHKIVVKVDVDGDGKFDDKDYVVQHRPYYIAPKG